MLLFTRVRLIKGALSFTRRANCSKAFPVQVFTLVRLKWERNGKKFWLSSDQVKNLRTLPFKKLRGSAGPVWTNGGKGGTVQVFVRSKICPDPPKRGFNLTTNGEHVKTGFWGKESVKHLVSSGCQKSRRARIIPTVKKKLNHDTRQLCIHLRTDGIKSNVTWFLRGQTSEKLKCHLQITGGIDHCYFFWCSSGRRCPCNKQ